MGSGTFEDRGPAGAGSPESEVWEWFSAALGWTLFNLPVDSFLLLSARGELSAQFVRGSDYLYCEVVADAGERAADAASARLRALGWDTPIRMRPVTGAASCYGPHGFPTTSWSPPP